MGNLTHTVSGDIASFRSAARVPIESLKCHFLPVQAGSGDASPDNIRPISGWSGIEIIHTGKNMIDASIFADSNYNITYNNGILTGTADNLFQKSFQNGKLVTNFKGKLHSTFSLSACTDGNQTTSGDGLQPFFHYSSGNKTLYTYSNATQTYLKKSLSLYNYNQTVVPEFFSFSYWSAPNNIWHIKELQWEMGDSVSDYEPYKGQIYNINWSNDAGTIYGGYVDIIKGELVAEYKLLTITGDESNLSINWDALLIPVPDSVSGNESQIVIACSHTNNCIHGTDVWSTSRGKNPNANTNNICVAGSSGSQLRFRKRDLDPDYTRDIELYKTWLRQQNADGTPLQIVYKLTTPVTYQLTAQQVKTFLDQNNIWSNTNDITEVSYQIHDSNMIQQAKKNMLAENNYHYRKVIWNQKCPPINSDNWRTYNTDFASYSFENDIASGVLKSGNYNGYRVTTRPIQEISIVLDHMYYFSYEVKPDFTGPATFSVEFAGGSIPNGIVVQPNVWTRISFITPGARTGSGLCYIPNLRSWGNWGAGSIMHARTPLYIDLTLMYGEGNEPDLKTFEKQCEKNGINLLQYQPLDVNGTQRWWII